MSTTSRWTGILASKSLVPGYRVRLLTLPHSGMHDSISSSNVLLSLLCHSQLSKGETIPGLSTVPNNGVNGTDADWQKWITAPSPHGFSAVSHPIGTAAMMKRSLGGTSMIQLLHCMLVTP